MSNTYTWRINYLDTKLQEGSLEKVVISCQWTVSGTDGTLTATNYGYAHFDSPNTENFTAYDSLTEEQVLNWVWTKSPENGGVDKSKMEENIDAQIEAQKNPPVVILPNPWNPPA